jgi:hypothetical protein
MHAQRIFLARDVVDDFLFGNDAIPSNTWSLSAQKMPPWILHLKGVWICLFECKGTNEKPIGAISADVSCNSMPCSFQKVVFGRSKTREDWDNNKEKSTGG